MVEMKLDMEVTEERAQRIKEALIRQYEDQYGVKVLGYEEKVGKKKDDTQPA